MYSKIVASGRSQNCSDFLNISERTIPKLTLSQHFKALREAGLIRGERKGVEMRNTSRCAEIEKRFPGLIKAILAQLKAGKDRGLAKVKIAVTSAESSGDLRYGIGTYEITGADGSHADHGKWMLVSKKSNGAWKTQCDIFNSDMPMPAMK